MSAFIAITPRNSTAAEVSLNCLPDHEIFYGVAEYPFGKKQSNDMPPISINIDRDTSLLSINDIVGIGFSTKGNMISFGFVGLYNGAIDHLYTIDDITGMLELKIRGKPNEDEFYRDVDTKGFATMQKNIFKCNVVKKLF